MLLIRILTLTGEEVEETEIKGFQSTVQTFHASNVVHGQLLQVRILCRYNKVSANLLFTSLAS